MTHPMHREAELSRPKSIEERVVDAKEWCDAYRLARPDVYFFQYGSALYHRHASSSAGIQPVSSLSASDIDMRCVYIAPLTPEEQARIRNSLSELLSPVPVELYFTPLADFNQGKIGSTGEMSNVTCIVKQLDPHEVVTSIQHSALVSLFSLATTRPFSAEQGMPRFLRATEEEAQLLSPAEVIDQLVLTRNDAIEWVHMYLKFALGDYYHFHGDSPDPASYAMRLSKYVVRIAFGVFVSKLAPEQLKDFKYEYAQRLVDNAHAFDVVHARMIAIFTEQFPGVFNGWSTQLLERALDTRVNGLERHLTGNAYTTGTEHFRQFIDDMEHLLLYLSLQVGVSDRRDEYPLADILLEVSLENSLARGEDSGRELMQPGEVLLEAGSEDDPDLFFIPRQMKDGQKNGEVLVNKNDHSFVLDDMLVGSLRALLPSVPRTATVCVGEHPVDLYRIKGSLVRALLKNERLHRLLSRPEFALSETIPDMLLAHALLTHLSYSSLYFVRDVASRYSADTDIVEHFDLPSIERQQNPLGLFFQGQFSSKVRELCSRIADPEDEVCWHEERTSAQEGRLLFKAGAQTTSALYVVLEGSVTVHGFSQDSHTITLMKDGIFGEASLLREKTRSASVTINPGSRVLAIDASLFENLTESFQLDQKLGCSPRELLYHIGAVNYQRIMRNVTEASV